MLAEISIRSLGGLGDGIAEYDGKPLFVPKACVGDRLKVRITQNSAQHARGQIVAVLSPGPERTTPPCPHFSDCGGCTLQQLEPQAYRKLKQQVVLNALHHAGYDTTPAPMLFIPAGSRRRVEMRLHRKDGKLSAAYYMPGTHTLLPVEHCLLLNADLQGFLPRLLAALEYWPHTEAIKSFKLTALDGGVELVLCIANNIPRPALTALAGSLDTARLCSERQSIYVINEPKPLTIRLGDYDVPLPPDSFLQATEAAQSALTHTVQEHTKDRSEE
ncbi:MAG: class I SAM-dependent RNA methyltransferase, partial [Alphaproteobacteria bacterium]